MADIDHAGAILVVGCDPMHEMPILELRIRKAVRRHGAQLLVAGERPTALDGGAAIGSRRLLSRPSATRPAAAPTSFASCTARSPRGDADDGFAAALRDAGSVVVVWSERMLAGRRAGRRPRRRCSSSPTCSGSTAWTAAGCSRSPAPPTDAASARSAAPRRSARATRRSPAGRSAAEIREALESGELEAVILWDVDPVRDFDDPEGWASAIGAADFTLSVSMFGTASAQNADVHLPAETFAEKEGTVTHPDGRLQRVRPSVPHPGAVRPLWQALTELSALLGDETGAGTAGEVFDLLAAEVPFYSGIDDRTTIGGMGIRWQEPHRRRRGGRGRSSGHSGSRAWSVLGRQ